MDTCIHCGADTGDECAWFLIYERRMKEKEQEIERLRQCLRYQDDRDGRIGTHGPAQLRWHRQVQGALREIERLRAERDALKSEANNFLGIIERLKAENNLLQAAQGMLKAERDALKALLRDVQEMTDKRWPGFASLKERIAEALLARGE